VARAGVRIDEEDPMRGVSSSNGSRFGAVAVLALQFAATFKEFPPRSFPPSFVPSTIMEETLDDIEAARRRGPPK
jgi:hypothetical protein